MATPLPTRIGFLLSLSALIGALLSSLLAPRLISWYFKPPVDFGVNCAPATEWAMQKLVVAQVVGALVAAGIAVFISLYFTRRAKNSSEV